MSIAKERYCAEAKETKINADKTLALLKLASEQILGLHAQVRKLARCVSISDREFKNVVDLALNPNYSEDENKLHEASSDLYLALKEPKPTLLPERDMLAAKDRLRESAEKTVEDLHSKVFEELCALDAEYEKFGPEMHVMCERYRPLAKAYFWIFLAKLFTLQLKIMRLGFALKSLAIANTKASPDELAEMITESHKSSGDVSFIGERKPFPLMRFLKAATIGAALLFAGGDLMANEFPSQRYARSLEQERGLRELEIKRELDRVQAQRQKWSQYENLVGKYEPFAEYGISDLSDLSVPDESIPDESISDESGQELGVCKVVDLNYWLNSIPGFISLERYGRILNDPPWSSYTSPAPIQETMQLKQQLEEELKEACSASPEKLKQLIRSLHHSLGLPNNAETAQTQQAKNWLTARAVLRLMSTFIDDYPYNTRTYGTLPGLYERIDWSFLF